MSISYSPIVKIFNQNGLVNLIVRIKDIVSVELVESASGNSVNVAISMSNGRVVSFYCSSKVYESLVAEVEAGFMGEFKANVIEGW